MDRFGDTSDDEVDHAFYESDFGEEKKTEENGECIEKGSTKEVLSDPDLIVSSKDTNCCEEENEEKQEDEQKSQFLEDSTDNPGLAASFSFPPVCENAGTSGATSAASRRMQENVPAGIPEINYYTDEEDSSDDGRKQKIRPKSAKQSYSVGGASRRYSTTSSSSSSSSSDTDSDSSSSDSLHSSSKRSACSVAFPSPKQKLASAIKLPEGKAKLGDHVEESESAVSKSDFSSHSFRDGVDLNQHLKAALQLENKEQQKLPVSHPSGRTGENFSANKVRNCSDSKAALELDKRQRKPGVIHPSRGTRKNYSFTNEEVRRIDQENRRLLQELARLCMTPGSRTNMLRKSASPSLHVYHSAINRQKEQQRIEKENLALLRRLTAVKPTPGMRRSEQLWDYQRYVSYANNTPFAREESSLSRQRGLSRGSSRAYTVSSTMRQKKEKPMSVSPAGASETLFH